MNSRHVLVVLGLAVACVILILLPGSARQSSSVQPLEVAVNLEDAAATESCVSPPLPESYRRESGAAREESELVVEVLTIGGRPLPAVELRVVSATGVVAETTTDLGIARVGVSKGVHWLYAAKKGWATSRAFVSVRAPGKTQVRLKLEPEAVILGRVLRCDGNYVTGPVDVEIRPEMLGKRDLRRSVEGLSCKVDDQGYFRFEGLPKQSYVIRLFSPNHIMTPPGMRIATAERSFTGVMHPVVGARLDLRDSVFGDPLLLPGNTRIVVESPTTDLRSDVMVAYWSKQPDHIEREIRRKRVYLGYMVSRVPGCDNVPGRFEVRWEDRILAKGTLTLVRADRVGESQPIPVRLGPGAGERRVRVAVTGVEEDCFASLRFVQLPREKVFSVGPGPLGNATHMAYLQPGRYRVALRRDAFSEERLGEVVIPSGEGVFELALAAKGVPSHITINAVDRVTGRPLKRFFVARLRGLDPDNRRVRVSWLPVLGGATTLPYYPCGRYEVLLIAGVGRRIQQEFVNVRGKGGSVQVRL